MLAGPDTKNSNRIKLVVFDMDGTITRPYLDFGIIRQTIGIPEESTLTLDYIQRLSGEERRRAFNILHGYEDDAAENAELREGVLEVIDELKRRNIVTAVLTRNSNKSVEIVFSKFGIDINHTYTRDNAPPKPDPTAIITLLKQYNLNKHQAVMVGDFWPDVETGRNAGIRTVLIRNEDSTDMKIEPDAEIKHFSELLSLIEKWSAELS